MSDVSTVCQRQSQYRQSCKHANTAVSDMYKHKPMYEYMNTHIIIPPVG